jgi:hypothetical protein
MVAMGQEPRKREPFAFAPAEVLCWATLASWGQ